MPDVNPDDKQGGKQYGAMVQARNEELDKLNAVLIDDSKYKEVEDLSEKLQAYKAMFIEIDTNFRGELDLLNLKLMCERLGQAKTHLELKKMIKEVDTTNSDTINYSEFVDMMLGKRFSVLKMILMFEEKKKEKEVPRGIPSKKSLDELP